MSHISQNISTTSSKQIQNTIPSTIGIHINWLDVDGMCSRLWQLELCSTCLWKAGSGTRTTTRRAAATCYCSAITSAVSLATWRYFGRPGTSTSPDNTRHGRKIHPFRGCRWRVWPTAQQSSQEHWCCFGCGPGRNDLVTDAYIILWSLSTTWQQGRRPCCGLTLLSSCLWL